MPPVLDRSEDKKTVPSDFLHLPYFGNLLLSDDQASTPVYFPLVKMGSFYTSFFILFNGS